VTSAKKVAGTKPNGGASNGTPSRRLSTGNQLNESKSTGRSAGKDDKKGASKNTATSLNEAAPADKEAADSSTENFDADPVPGST
jgi:hypothetical protein